MMRMSAEKACMATEISRRGFFDHLDRVTLKLVCLFFNPFLGVSLSTGGKQE